MPGSGPGWPSTSTSPTPGRAISGELRLAGGAQGRTRFGTARRPADPVGQDLSAVRPAAGVRPRARDQPGRRATGPLPRPRRRSRCTTRPSWSSASSPSSRATSSASLDLLPEPEQRRATHRRRSTVADLPVRVEAWGVARPAGLAGHRLGAPDHRTARRRCAAGSPAAGGWSSSAARPDRPACRPSPTRSCPTARRPPTDVEPASLGALLGEVPADARPTLPALSGELTEGRALATCRRSHGRGRARLRQRLGDDRRVRPDRVVDRRNEPGRRHVAPPPADPVAAAARSSATTARSCPRPRSCRRSRCRRSAGSSPCWAPTSCSSGPINYLVLRRLDRREWAWVTMPVLIVAFAAGAYGFGSLLRGSDLIVNEVAIVRGSPGATEGTAQIYLGVFSPSRGTYQLRVPGGALLSSPTNGDFLGGDGTTATLDVLQGDPAQVRDLGVGFGSLRTVRAETAVERAPRAGRPAARGRAPEGHGHERLGRGPAQAGRRPRRHGRQAGRPGAGRLGSRSTSRSRPCRWASSCRTGSSAR